MRNRAEKTTDRHWRWPSLNSSSHLWDLAERILPADRYRSCPRAMDRFEYVRISHWPRTTLNPRPDSDRSPWRYKWSPSVLNSSVSACSSVHNEWHVETSPSNTSNRARHWPSNERDCHTTAWSLVDIWAGRTSSHGMAVYRRMPTAKKSDHEEEREGLVSTVPFRRRRHSVGIFSTPVERRAELRRRLASRRNNGPSARYESDCSNRAIPRIRWYFLTMKPKHLVRLFRYSPSIVWEWVETRVGFYLHRPLRITGALFFFEFDLEEFKRKSFAMLIVNLKASRRQ